MGDLNQYRWIQNHIHLMKSPVLEIGSKHYAKVSSMDYRQLSQEHGLEYWGVDMEEGPNVDQVLDMTQPLDEVKAQLDSRKFKSIICCSVMEHVQNIFLFAQNLTHITEEEGVLFLSVPFVWRFHGYPSDYWRFSPEALKYLYPEFEFHPCYSTLSSNVVGDMVSFAKKPNDFCVKGVPYAMNQDKTSPFHSYLYMLAPTSINMVGIKKGTAITGD